MSRRDHQPDNTAEQFVHFDGEGVLRLPGRVIGGVHADLVGGRNRYSVGGQVAEGPRWWRGRIDWPGDEVEPSGGIEITIELDNGRSAVAVVEPAPDESAHAAIVHGIGPPPFDVP